MFRNGNSANQSLTANRIQQLLSNPNSILNHEYVAACQRVALLKQIDNRLIRKLIMREVRAQKREEQERLKAEIKKQLSREQCEQFEEYEQMRNEAAKQSNQPDSFFTVIKEMIASGLLDMFVFTTEDYRRIETQLAILNQRNNQSNEQENSGSKVNSVNEKEAEEAKIEIAKILQELIQITKEVPEICSVFESAMKELNLPERLTQTISFRK